MTTDKKTHGFQAEVKQLLKLMINSLYSNKEIAVRELISNASDACDRLRFLALSDENLYEGKSDLKIHFSFDKENRTLTISDNGIGMNHDEVVQNIGTIAKSGTKEFFESLTGDNKKDANLIGQFGVGFYSSFIIADKVTLKTRKAGEDKSEGIIWESAGEGDYTIEKNDKDDRGTEVILHLRDGEDEFLDPWTLKGIIRKYSDHISLPITMTVEEEDENKQKTIKEETVNKASALWRRPKTSIKNEEYKEFYKTVAHDFGDPLSHIHARMEGTLEYSFLFYIPEKAPFDLWTKEHPTGVKLYVKRTFIMDESDKLLPRYLRFIRGVIDSDDLPINISREILQENQIITSIRNTAVKKTLDHLEDMAKNKKEDYAKFWKEFGAILKEGVVEDFPNKERLAQLARFSSTFDNKDTQEVSLDDYLFRLKPNQDKIYYITADSFESGKNSPLLEIFRKKEIEVLLLSDRVDHWMVTHLSEFKGKKLQSVSKGDIELNKDDADKTESNQEDTKTDKSHDELTTRLSEALKDIVKEVKVSQRLTTSPACIVSDQNDLDPSLKRLFETAGQKMDTDKPILEINPDHMILKKIAAEKDEKQFKAWSDVLFDQAILSDGGQLKDPAGFVRKLNELIVAMQG